MNSGKVEYKILLHKEYIWKVLMQRGTESALASKTKFNTGFHQKLGPQ